MKLGDGQPNLDVTAAGIWPPPPTGMTPVATFPFKTEFRYVEGSVPEFRVGSLTFSEAGVLIQGKSVTRYEVQVPVLLACLFLRLGWLIAYLVMEYAIRRDASLQVPWPQVRKVVLDSVRHRACLVYDAPNYKGVVKPFSLTTRLAASDYQAFVASVKQFAPGRVGEGKTRAWTSPVVWVVCIAILLLLLIILLIIGIGLVVPSIVFAPGGGPR